MPIMFYHFLFNRDEKEYRDNRTNRSGSRDKQDLDREKGKFSSISTWCQVFIPVYHVFNFFWFCLSFLQRMAATVTGMSKRQVEGAMVLMDLRGEGVMFG